MIQSFYLGIHRAYWLPRVTTPVFISRRVFPKGPFPRAAGRYAVDSGGFTELQKFGRWTITPAEYVALAWRAKHIKAPDRPRDRQLDLPAYLDSMAVAA